MANNNPSGYLLLVAGGIALGAGLGYARHGSGWALLASVASVAVGLTMLFAAVRILRKRPPRD